MSKNLKQARLPFTPVDARGTKKRSRPSEDESDKSTKITCLEKTLSPECETSDNSKSSAVKRLSDFQYSGSEKLRKFGKENNKSRDSKLSVTDSIPKAKVVKSSNPQIKETESKIDTRSSLNSEPKLSVSEDDLTTTVDSVDKSEFSDTGEKRGKCEKNITEKSPKLKERNILDKMFKKMASKSKSWKPCGSEIIDNEVIVLDSIPGCSKSEECSNSTQKIEIGISENQESISEKSKLSQNGQTDQDLLNKSSDSLNSTEVDVNLTSVDGNLTDKSVDESINDSDISILNESASVENLPETSNRNSPNSIDRKTLITKQKKLTPKQKKWREKLMKQRLEKEKIKEEKEKERERLKEEKEKERERLKEKKLAEIEEKKRMKEEMRQKKEEELLKREQKKEIERQKREEEKSRKEEEKQKKEIERQKREEEKQKKEEEKQQLQDEEREKQEKLKAKFAQFFIAKKSAETLSASSAKTELEADSRFFSRFQVKENMKVAPIQRKVLGDSNRDLLDRLANFDHATHCDEINYLDELKNVSYVVGKSTKTFPALTAEEYDDDCEILSETESDAMESLAITNESTDEKLVTSSQEDKRRMRAKLLQFCENSRPAYYGTWLSKKPKVISGRRPFARDEHVFNYDYDSDEDWEDVENGESLSDSENEAEEGADEEVNQYEVDNEFFVPHGYLSDGEGEEEDHEQSVETPESKDVTVDENQKEKLKQKQEEFELEMKQKTKHLKPKVFGCVWLGDKSSHQAYEQLLRVLSVHTAKPLFGSFPINIPSKDVQTNDSPKPDEGDDENSKFLKSFPEEAIPDLIRLLHGNRRSKQFLMQEFYEFWKRKQNGETLVEDMSKSSPNSAKSLSRRKILMKIQEIGQYERISENGVPLRYKCWNVSLDFRAKYGLQDLSIVNSWTYILSKESGKLSQAKDDNVEDTSFDTGSATPEAATPTVTPAKTPSNNLITMFTKVLDDDEKRKLSSPSPANPKLATLSTYTPKLKPAESCSPLAVTSTPTSSKRKQKRRAEDSLSDPKQKRRTSVLLNLFKNMDSSKSKNPSESTQSSNDSECITLD